MAQIDDIFYAERLDHSYVVDSINKLNQIGDVIVEPINTEQSTTETLCWKLIEVINAIDERTFARLCHQSAFKGNIEDLYEVLTGQKEPTGEMLKASRIPFENRRIDLDLKPEKNMEDVVKNKKKTSSNIKPPEEHIRPGMMMEIPLPHDLKSKDPNRDVYGFRAGNQSSRIMKLAEQNKYSIKDIQDELGLGKATTPWVVFKQINDRGEFSVKQQIVGTKRIVVVRALEKNE